MGESPQEKKRDGVKARLSRHEGRLHIKSRSLWLKDSFRFKAAGVAIYKSINYL